MSENKTPWCPHVRQAIAGRNAVAFETLSVAVGIVAASTLASRRGSSQIPWCVVIGRGLN